MRATLTAFRRCYGSTATHLLVLAGCFAIAGYAVLRVADNPMLPRMAVWFVGAVVVHDLVLFPLYSAADRAFGAVSLPWRGGVTVLNHVRVPTMATALLFLLFFPGIIEQGSVTYRAATGQTQDPFLARWLLLSAAFYAVSLVHLLFRPRRRRAHQV
jgi:hypothetical protein